MKGFNYNAVGLLDKYEHPRDVPIEVLKSLNVYSEDIHERHQLMDWFTENFGAIKVGYKSNEDWEADMMDMMYPEGYDPDSDSDVFKD